jgi:hypothetical protein
MAMMSSTVGGGEHIEFTPAQVGVQGCVIIGVGVGVFGASTVPAFHFMGGGDVELHTHKILKYGE